MNKPSTCSLLISTYNWPQALDLVLKTVTLQTVVPNEVVIADDGSTDATFKIIDRYKALLNIKHVWQSDDGFRKTLIMNKAIKEITQDYIIQIDGDMLLHSKFIEDHLFFAKKNYFTKGSRAMLSEPITNQIIKEKTLDFSYFKKNVKSKINATRLPAFAFLFFGNKKRTNNLRGCNFSFWKKDFVGVNGYNNDLTGWGHEDIELAARLVNNGVQRRQLKMVAICYHLYHKINPRVNELDNLTVYKETVLRKIATIPNGFHQLKTAVK